jgi:hypothetical protein
MKKLNQQGDPNMAKAVALTADDLAPKKPRTTSATRQRGAVPSAELIPLQFRMPPDFVRGFKQAALDRDMKLNELLNECFNEFMKLDGK